MQPTKRPSAQRKSAQVVVAMMGTDNITCPSEGPVAGCAVGVSASAGMRDLVPNPRQLERAAGWVPDRLDGRPTPWQGGMLIIDCPGERRVRENRTHGVGGGGRKRADDARPMWIAGWYVGGAPLVYLTMRGWVRS